MPFIARTVTTETQYKCSDLLPNMVQGYGSLQMELKIIPVQGGQPPSQGMTWKEFNTSLDEIVTTSSERLRKKLFSEAEVAARIDGYRETVPLMRLSRILLINCKDNNLSGMQKKRFMGFQRRI